jgi:hypothetical protein
VAADRDAKTEKSPVDQVIEQALDLFVYAPIGAALTARDEFPIFIAKGRERVTGQLTLAKMFGQFAVAQGQREAQKLAEKLREQAIERATRLAGAASKPTPSAPRAASNGSQTAGAAAAVSGAAAALASDPAMRALPPRRSTPAAGPVSPAESVAAAGNGSPTRPAVDAPPVGDLAIPGYDNLSASQVVQRLAGLSTPELEAVRRYEAATRGRRTILSKVSQLQSGPAGR